MCGARKDCPTEKKSGRRLGVGEAPRQRARRRSAADYGQVVRFGNGSGPLVTALFRINGSAVSLESLIQMETNWSTRRWGVLGVLGRRNAMQRRLAARIASSKRRGEEAGPARDAIESGTTEWQFQAAYGIPHQALAESYGTHCSPPLSRMLITSRSVGPELSGNVASRRGSEKDKQALDEGYVSGSC